MEPHSKLEARREVLIDFIALEFYFDFISEFNVIDYIVSFLICFNRESSA